MVFEGTSGCWHLGLTFNGVGLVLVISRNCCFFDPTCRCGYASRVKFCLAGMVRARFEVETWLGREVSGVLPRLEGETWLGRKVSGVLPCFENETWLGREVLGVLPCFGGETGLER